MNKLIVSLDVDDFTHACELIDLLSPQVNCFKVGIAPFTAFGELLLEKLRDLNKNVFLDLKFHDIPNTVKNAAKAAAAKGVFMMNFHCLGGERMLEAAVEGVRNVKDRPLLIGVTVLTSMSETDMQQLGLNGTVREKVITLAQMAKKCGLDGVVASAQEARIIKQEVGKDFLVVTPGIRPAWSYGKEDQRRVLTPNQAMSEGADYLVVGRPIIKADDPLEAAKKIIKEAQYGTKNRNINQD